MRCCPQGWSEAWKPQGNWTWTILGSIVVHGLLLSGMLLGFRDGPAQKRLVVPVEAIALVPGAPGGGGGRCGPTTRPQTVAAKPKPVRPRPQRRVKARARPKVKLTPPTLEPTKAPVIPTPAAAPARTRSKVAAPATTSRARTSSATTSRARTSSAATGASGSGQGGRRGGRGRGSGGGVGAGQGRGSGAGSALQGYLHMVRRQLEKQKEYPFMARRRQIQGVVVLLFTIAASGQVEGSRINRSSGSDLLDEAARNTVRRIRRFPPFPPNLKRRQLTVQVPLAFRLHND